LAHPGNRKHAPATLQSPVIYRPCTGVVDFDEKRHCEYSNGQRASRSETGRLKSIFFPICPPDPTDRPDCRSTHRQGFGL